jgi:hypothetical protein
MGRGSHQLLAPGTVTLLARSERLSFRRPLSLTSPTLAGE